VNASLLNDLHRREKAEPFASPSYHSTGGSFNPTLSIEYNRQRYHKTVICNANTGMEKKTRKFSSLAADVAAEEGDNVFGRRISFARSDFDDQQVVVEDRVKSFAKKFKLSPNALDELKLLLSSSVGNADTFHRAQHKEIVQELNKKAHNDSRKPYAGEPDDLVALKVISPVLNTMECEGLVLQQAVEEYFQLLGSNVFVDDDKLFDSLAPKLQLLAPITVHMICKTVDVPLEVATRDCESLPKLPVPVS
jgi:hypothetical protein